jgi:SAM-dependent methyltransferase
MTQHQIFLQGEGDAWFARNMAVLSNEGSCRNDLVFSLLDRVNLSASSKVLEVGAANGYRLAAINRKHGSAVTGVDPSEKAIDDGHKRYPLVRFVRGLAHELLGFADGSFDLVIVNAVMHWVDRDKLLPTVSEIDRVLKAAGHLIVGDFLPAVPQRIKYHHLPGADVWTYKQDYPHLWLASNLYSEQYTLIADHSTKMVTERVDPAHRWKVTILKKEPRDQYAFGELLAAPCRASVDPHTA